jgi:heparan-alpha-glucosaminide N-acetyltransferase
MQKIRIPGILQRIAFAYLVVSLMIMYLPKRTSAGWVRAGAFSQVRGPVWSRTFRYYSCHWLVASLSIAVYGAVLFGLWVPDWNVPGTNVTVHCNTRGDLSPKCSAARLVDQWVLGWDHMCRDLFAHRLPECSSCYPEDCPKPEGERASWCGAPFDPEGVLASLPTVMSTWLGLHFGLVRQHHKETHAPSYIVKFWAAEATALVGLGWIIHAAGWSVTSLPSTEPPACGYGVVKCKRWRACVCDAVCCSVMLGRESPHRSRKSDR